jgi:hypothetical protein
MRYAAVAAWVAGAILSACSAAHSASPDSRNPAHCIAAFNYGAYWLKLGHKDRGVRNMYVRGAYEMEKVKASGRTASEALAEGKALTQRYARDTDAMDRLFEECGQAQDADPKFREAQPRLIAQLKEAGTN